MTVQIVEKALRNVFAICLVCPFSALDDTVRERRRIT